MSTLDWANILAGGQRPTGPRPIVKFFMALNENRDKSLAAGRPIYDEIPTISLRFPGGDETCRKIEPQDIQAYPEAYKAFQAGTEVPESGTPLAEWPPLTVSAVKELAHLGFRTVEQLAEAPDAVKPRLGTLGRFIKMAKDYLEAAKDPQLEAARVNSLLEVAEAKNAKLQEQIGLLISRIEALEGSKLDDGAPVAGDEAVDIGEVDAAPIKQRGRPRKVA